MANDSDTAAAIESLGFCIASVFSYMKWHGIWLAIGHGFIGWFYVIYYLIKYGNPIR